MSDVLIRIEEGVGRISLNRPTALHALNYGMCEAIVDALRRWQHDAAIACVMIDHSEGRGFCAGGDIRMLAESGAKDGVEARAFFHLEYQMNHLMFNYAKPIVVFMDGITMGGGVGLSMPCQYRVATEQTLFAMPETGIGLFPDVGGGWYLSRLPGRTGYWLALTGARINGADCCYLEIATHYMRSENLTLLKAAILEDPEDLRGILNEFAGDTPSAPIEAIREDIDRLFAGNVLEKILADLAADTSGWGKPQLDILKTKSPQSCKIALRQLREAAALTSFGENMKREYTLAFHIVVSPDFLEGVRAVIVDKDNAPKWSPATPEEFTGPMLEAFFTPLPPHAEWEPL
jgi:enoyl-CoA hydratase/carnithine racemase